MSFWHKYWPDSVTAIEKWHHSCLDWFHISLSVTVLFSHQARSGKMKLNYGMKEASLLFHKWNRNRHCFSQSLSTGNSETTGKLWKLHCTAKEREPCWWRRKRKWRGRVIDTKQNESEKKDTDQWRALWCRSLFPRWYLFAVTTGDLRWFSNTTGKHWRGGKVVHFHFKITQNKDILRAVSQWTGLVSVTWRCFTSYPMGFISSN